MIGALDPIPTLTRPLKGRKRAIHVSRVIIRASRLTPFASRFTGAALVSDIVLRDVEKYFGDNYIIRKLNLEIRAREFVVLLGPSGCGKTTTLRAIAGLEDIDSGDILIDGKAVQNLQAADRDIAFVFQLFALYPHLTAYENIAFPLRAMNESKTVVDQRVREVAKTLRIDHLLRETAVGAVRGRHAARCDRTRTGAPPEGTADGRADRSAGCQAARRNAHGIEAHSLQNEATTVYVTHDQVGGDGDGRQDRDHERRRVAAGRHVRPRFTIIPATCSSRSSSAVPIMNVDRAVRCDRRTGARHWCSARTMRRCRSRASSTIEWSSIATPRMSCPSACGRKVCSSRVSLTAGYIPVEAHIIEPLGPFDIVDLKIGKLLVRARTPSGFVEKAGDVVWARLDEKQTHFFSASSGASMDIRL